MTITVNLVLTTTSAKIIVIIFWASYKVPKLIVLRVGSFRYL